MQVSRGVGKFYRVILLVLCIAISGYGGPDSPEPSGPRPAPAGGSVEGPSQADMSKMVNDCICTASEKNSTTSCADTALLTDDQTQCVCNALKKLRAQNFYFQSGVMGEYCQAFETAAAGVPVESVLTVLDAIAAGTCWAACLNPGNPSFEAQCNCAGFVEGTVDYGWEGYLMATDVSYNRPDALKILTGPVLSGLGFIAGATDIMSCSKLRGGH